LRQCFVELAEKLFGPQDTGAWQRFQQERLPVLLSEALPRPDNGSQEEYLRYGVRHWLAREPFRGRPTRPEDN
jgi:hypothetical protein